MGQIFQQLFMFLTCGHCDVVDLWLQSRPLSSTYKQWGTMTITVMANPEPPKWENNPTEKSVVQQRTEPRFTVSFMSRQSSAFPPLLCVMDESLLRHYHSPPV